MQKGLWHVGDKRQRLPESGQKVPFSCLFLRKAVLRVLVTPRVVLLSM